MKAVAYFVAIGALTFAVAAACGPRQQEAETPAESESLPEITVKIENRNRNDAHVYLLLSGERTRLGEVPSGIIRTFSFAARPTEIRMEISWTRGGRGFISRPMSVSPGDELVLVIATDGRLLRCPFAQCPR